MRTVWGEGNTGGGLNGLDSIASSELGGGKAAVLDWGRLLLLISGPGFNEAINYHFGADTAKQSYSHF